MSKKPLKAPTTAKAEDQAEDDTTTTEAVETVENTTATQDVDAAQLANQAETADDPKSNVEGSTNAHGGIRESITEHDITADDAADDDTDDELEDDDDDAVESVSTGAGEVVGNGEVQSFISGNETADVGGDGVTGKSNDGQTYQSPDGATGADTHSGGLGIGTTPVSPQAATADALVASVVHPKRVETAVIEVIRDFISDGPDKAISAMSNLFDDVGMHRADLANFAAKLNSEFGTTLTVGEAQNFLLVRDVQNMMKRKLAVASALAD